MPLNISTPAIGVLCTTLGLGLLGARTLGAEEGPPPRSALYDQLQAWRFSAQPAAVPEGGHDFQLDTASWHLESGQLWLQEPTAEGRITGLVFEGRGRFRMAVPDALELRQLRRFAEDPGLETLDLPFERLVLRSSGGEPFEGLATGVGYDVHPLARDRHEHWLRQRWEDADAAVVAALLNPGERYLLAEMETPEGWLSYTFDSRRLEEVHLERWHEAESFAESWVALDRAEDRGEDGRPSFRPRPAIDVEHVEVRADLTRPGRDPQRGLSLAQPVDARLEATLRLRLLQGGVRALSLYLSPLAEVLSVRDAEGRELPFLRDHIGARSRGIDKRLYDSSLVVLLAEPRSEGEHLRLDFDYRMELANYAPGRSWYPGERVGGTGLLDPHTARLELTYGEHYGVRGMGRLVETREEKKHTTEVWEVEEPTKMVTFGLARKLHAESFEFDGLPEVVAFGSLDGYMNEERIRNVGADVVNSLNFFQGLFGERLAADPLFATTIADGHGQAFEGFLHVADYSTLDESVGPTELFRAHEVAHQWWGHQVGWASYRDQWLSEAFAEYSAMLFVEARVENGQKLFQEVLRTYQDQLQGSIKTVLGRFSRPGLITLNGKALERVGPIGHGHRCGTGEAPSAYVSQVYMKGALVLHMLRVLTRGITRSEETFVEILRDFIDTHRGGAPTTADFQAIVTEHAPADWSWFFDQWVYGAEIPTYAWDYEVAPAPGGDGQLLRLTVEQSGVPDGFRMAVPVRFELAGGKGGEALVMIGQPQQTIELKLPARPKKVVLNPDHAVLAKMKKL